MSSFADAVNKTQRDLIENIVKNFYFVDIGIIKSVSADKTKVDIIHAGLPNINGTAGAPITSTGIELVWSGCLNVQVKYELQAGDPVLLLGTRDFIQTMNGLKAPNKPAVNLQYRQENMKAIPFGVQPNALATINVSSTKIEITALQEIDVKGSMIKMQDGTDAFIKGDALYNQLFTLLTAMSAITTPVSLGQCESAVGAIAAAATAMLAVLNLIKSTTVFAS